MPEVEYWDIEELSKTEFTIGETRFYIKTMPAIPAFNLGVQILREAGKVGLADVLYPVNRETTITARIADVTTSEVSFMHDLLNGVLQLDPDFVEYVRERVFAYVQYTVPGQQGRYDLNVSPEVVLNDVLDVGEVLVRCIVVFFIGSSQSRVRKLLRQFQNSNPSTPQESPPS